MHDDIATLIGPRLREARLRSGQSQADIAERSGLSLSFVRMVEAGRSDIALSRLLRWASIFDLTLADLFGSEEDRDILVTRPHERVTVGLGEAGVKFQLLAPAANKQLEPGLFRLAPRSVMRRWLQHPGEESLTVVAGRLLLHVGSRRVDLAAGDTAYFRSTLPHRLENPSTDAAAEALSTATHATRQEHAAMLEHASTQRAGQTRRRMKH